MRPEKWQETIGHIKDNFEVAEQKKEHLDEQGGLDIESIIFKGPLGRMKLEFISRPVVLDKKTTYSRRIGSQTQVDYVYSDQEKSHKLLAYKWDEEKGDWLGIDAKNFDK